MPELYIPGGKKIHLGDNVEGMNRHDLHTIANMHTVAQKHEIQLVCRRCRQAFHGENTGHETQPRIVCACREIRFDPDLR